MALVIAGVGIACGSLASLAVIVLVAVVPWSRFRPRYQRGVQADEEPARRLGAAGRALRAAAGGARRPPARRAPISRHPQGGRHLLPLGR